MKTTNPSITGGCACGAISYASTSTPLFSFHCQCRACQKMTGTGHSSAFICRDAETEFSGQLTWFERQAPSGNVVKQGFCATCGSPVVNRNSGYPDKVYLTAGSMNEPSGFKPQKVVHRDEGHVWDLVDPEV